MAIANFEASTLPHQFVKNLVSSIIQEYNDEIVSIALFGSAATQEWKKGKSDVDFIVVIKNEKRRKKVEDSINNILIRLDKKHDLKLVQTCSTFVKHRNPLVNFLYRIEDAVTFGKPFFVFSLDQIKFENETIADARIRFISAVFDPLIIFLAKMKQTGVTIYGQNLIKRIHYHASFLKKIRIAMAPLWVLLMGLISFPLDEKFALKHSVKATLWACEDSLFALDRPLSNTYKEANMIMDIFGESINITHLKRTLILKQTGNQESIISKGFVAKHILQTTSFIFHLYYQTSLLVKKESAADSRMVSIIP
jgi:predicted nucleotidyltransferase